ncbi:MAG: TQO small subunit DoxD [Acidiferrobacter sp.]
MANKLQGGMPGAVLGIGHILSAILHHPALVYWLLVLVSAVELVSGLGLILGVLTRLNALLSMGLSVSLMLLFGWQGATCIDEWTMASATFAMACTVFAAGSGLWSIDGWLMKRNPRLADAGWFRWLGSAPFGARELDGWGKGLAIIAILFSLVFYNYYRGSIFSPFHSGPVSAGKHHIRLTHGSLSASGRLKVFAYLNGGTPAVPSHVVRVMVIGPQGTIETWSGKALEKAVKGHIHNVYIYNKFGPGLFGIKAKMGAKAWVTLRPAKPAQLSPGRYTIIFQNINGKKFKTDATVS